MIALAAALIHFIPFGQGIEDAIRKFVLGNFLPQKTGAIIAKYVGSFADRANRVTFLGVILLVLTALIQMFTIERAFNAIWRVRTNRHIARRAIVHMLAMTLGPLIFGMSLAATTFVMTKSLGWLDEPMWVTLLINKGIPFVIGN